MEEASADCGLPTADCQLPTILNYVNLTLVKTSYLLFHHLYIHKIT